MVKAYKNLLKEKEALEASVKILTSTAPAKPTDAVVPSTDKPDAATQEDEPDTDETDVKKDASEEVGSVSFHNVSNHVYIC